MYSDPNGHWSLWGAISSAASNISSEAKAVTSAITSSSVYKAASSVVSSAVQKVKSTATYQKAAAAVAPVKAKAVVVAKNAVTQVKEAAKQISAPPTPKVTKTASVVKTTSTTTSSSLATTSSSSKSSGGSRSSSKTSTSSKNTLKAAVNNATQRTGGTKSTTLQKAGNYLASSAKQVVLGNYTDDVTLLGTAGQVAAGLLNADLPGDIRDLTYDVTNWEWSWSHAGQTTVDAIGLIPVIGAVKYADEVGTLLKNSDEAAAALKGGTGNAKTYQTYTKTNPVTGEVYSGRTSGTGTPLENIRTRDGNHHMNDKGFGPAVLDVSSSNKAAIRGREQMLIEANGGAKSTGGTSGNAINGIGPNNPKGSYYLEEALKEFMK